MAIPLATTSVTIKGKRPQSAEDPDSEGWDSPPAEAETLASGVRATITLPRASRNNSDNDEVVSYALRCDPINVDVTRFDTVIDDTTGIEYNVASAAHSHPITFGLDHITATLYVSKGLTTAGGGVSVPT